MGVEPLVMEKMGWSSKKAEEGRKERSDGKDGDAIANTAASERPLFCQRAEVLEWRRETRGKQLPQH